MPSRRASLTSRCRPIAWPGATSPPARGELMTQPTKGLANTFRTRRRARLLGRGQRAHPRWLRRGVRPHALSFSAGCPGCGCQKRFLTTSPRRTEASQPSCGRCGVASRRRPSCSPSQDDLTTGDRSSTTGPYEYRASEPDPERSHVRPVKWIKTDIPRTAAKQDLLRPAWRLLECTAQVHRNEAALRRGNRQDRD